MDIDENIDRFELRNQSDIEEFHKQAYGGIQVSLTIYELEILLKGYSIGWADSEYTTVLSLDDEARTYLNKLMKLK